MDEANDLEIGYRVEYATSRGVIKYYPAEQDGHERYMRAPNPDELLACFWDRNDGKKVRVLRIESARVE